MALSWMMILILICRDLQLLDIAEPENLSHSSLHLQDQSLEYFLPLQLEGATQLFQQLIISD